MQVIWWNLWTYDSEETKTDQVGILEVLMLKKYKRRRAWESTYTEHIHVCGIYDHPFSQQYSVGHP